MAHPHLPRSPAPDRLAERLLRGAWWLGPSFLNDPPRTDSFYFAGQRRQDTWFPLLANLNVLMGPTPAWPKSRTPTPPGVRATVENTARRGAFNLSALATRLPLNTLALRCFGPTLHRVKPAAAEAWADHTAHTLRLPNITFPARSSAPRGPKLWGQVAAEVLLGVGRFLVGLLTLPFVQLQLDYRRARATDQNPWFGPVLAALQATLVGMVRLVLSVVGLALLTVITALLQTMQLVMTYPKASVGLLAIAAAATLGFLPGALNVPVLGSVLQLPLSAGSLLNLSAPTAMAFTIAWLVALATTQTMRIQRPGKAKKAFTYKQLGFQVLGYGLMSFGLAHLSMHQLPLHNLFATVALMVMVALVTSCVEHFVIPHVKALRPRTLTPSTTPAAGRPAAAPRQSRQPRTGPTYPPKKEDGLPTPNPDATSAAPLRRGAAAAGPSDEAQHRHPDSLSREELVQVARHHGFRGRDAADAVDYPNRHAHHFLRAPMRGHGGAGRPAAAAPGGHFLGGSGDGGEPWLLRGATPPPTPSDVFDATGGSRHGRRTGARHGHSAAASSASAAPSAVGYDRAGSSAAASARTLPSPLPPSGRSERGESAATPSSGAPHRHG